MSSDPFTKIDSTEYLFDTSKMVQNVVYKIILGKKGAIGVKKDSEGNITVLGWIT